MYSRGEIIYKYKLDTLIGRGNFGEVWSGTDIAIDSKKIAIKILSITSSEKEQINQEITRNLIEAKIGSKLSHDNLIEIKAADIVTHNGKNLVIIAMPYLPKGAVTSHLNPENFLSIGKTLRCINDILRGLEYLHFNNFYHCDIKPNNILCGNKNEYILSDYGITCITKKDEVALPQVFYQTHRAPECIFEKIYDTRSDIYQVGLTMFRLLNGISLIENDLKSDQVNFFNKVKEGKVIQDSDYLFFIPKSIRQIIQKAISLNPDDRYQNSLEMRRALEKISIMYDCDFDSEYNYVFFDKEKKYQYRFEVIPKNKLFDVIFYKKHSLTKKEVKVSSFSASGLTKSNKIKYLSKIAQMLILHGQRKGVRK